MDGQDFFEFHFGNIKIIIHANSEFVRIYLWYKLNTYRSFLQTNNNFSQEINVKVLLNGVI